MKIVLERTCADIPGGNRLLAAYLRDRIDWSAFPKLADIFENRPPENVYWDELVRLMDHCTAIQRRCGEIVHVEPEQ